ncbi:MAG: hypothetical protein E7L31_21155, partial [Aeromonas sp.]|nr:hypothetical protein [Aeromonas sp.]
VVEGRGQGVHREDRLSHPGRTDAVNPVLVNRYDTMVEEVKTAFGDAHAINILQHKNFLAARKFADMFDRGEL